MTNVEEYDLVVLGSGEAGKYIAWTLAAQGQRAAVIERRYVGGSCPNIACLPSKNVIHSAKVISLLRRGMEFGVGSMEWAVDMAAVRARRGLGRTVHLEMALELILLLAVGVLSSVFPAFDALQAQQQQGFIERANADGVDIPVRVAPGEARTTRSVLNLPTPALVLR